MKDGEKVCSIKNTEETITYFDNIPEDDFDELLEDIYTKARKQGKTANEYLDRQIGVIEEFKTLKPLKVAEEYLGKKQDGLFQAFKIEDNTFKVSNKPANGFFDYVVLKSGEMKIGKGHYLIFNYSDEVLAAGRIELKEGKIDFLDNQSGHFRPEVSDLVNYANIFSRQKLLSKTVEVRKIR